VAVAAAGIVALFVLAGSWSEPVAPATLSGTDRAGVRGQPISERLGTAETAQTSPIGNGQTGARTTGASDDHPDQKPKHGEGRKKGGK
jgi:hypothetical protein